MCKAPQPGVHLQKPLPHRPGNLLRKNSVQAGKRHPRPIGRKHRSKAGADPALHKVPYPLDRRSVAAARNPECLLFNFFLQKHTCQRMLGVKIRRPDPDQQRGIRVYPVPCIVAHAIGDHPPLFAGRSNHLTAGTHAERVHAPSIL